MPSVNACAPVPEWDAASEAAIAARLDQLRAMVRPAGEATHFWYEHQFQKIAVKVLPGEYAVHDESVLIMTTLGSCIAACLWDPGMRIGGLNHFLLPECDSPDLAENGKYGAYAMNKLVGEMTRRGASRAALQAKVFGGAQVVSGMHQMNVGERNTRFAMDYLRSADIPVTGKDVLDVCARKICFMPASGKVLVKRLASTHTAIALAAL